MSECSILKPQHIEFTMTAPPTVTESVGQLRLPGRSAECCRKLEATVSTPLEHHICSSHHGSSSTPEEAARRKSRCNHGKTNQQHVLIHQIAATRRQEVRRFSVFALLFVFSPRALLWLTLVTQGFSIITVNALRRITILSNFQPHHCRLIWPQRQ